MAKKYEFFSDMNWNSDYNSMPWSLYLKVVEKKPAIRKLVISGCRSSFNDEPDNYGVEMTDRKGWWHKRKFAVASIALTLFETGSFILAALLINYSLVNSEPSPSPGVQGATIHRFLEGVWLIGSPLSFISALFAIGLDSHRSLAAVAFVISVLGIIICTLQVLV